MAERPDWHDIKGFVEGLLVIVRAVATFVLAAGAAIWAGYATFSAMGGTGLLLACAVGLAAGAIVFALFYWEWLYGSVNGVNRRHDKDES